MKRITCSEEEEEQTFGLALGQPWLRYVRNIIFLAYTFS